MIFSLGNLMGWMSCVGTWDACSHQLGTSRPQCAAGGPLLESGESCKRSPTVEVIAVHPNENFTYEKSPYTDAQNSILFKGSENMIYQQWDWTCSHICIFNYLWYPFDTQNCPIILNNTLQSFQIKDNHIWYSGDTNLLYWTL